MRKSESGRELVRRFWIVTMQGGYATHGETFLHPQDVIWWARGGRLTGEAPKRIAFLRSILESIGGPLTFHSLDMTEEEFVSWKERMIPHAGMPNIDRILYPQLFLRNGLRGLPRRRGVPLAKRFVPMVLLQS